MYPSQKDKGRKLGPIAGMVIKAGIKAGLALAEAADRAEENLYPSTYVREDLRNIAPMRPTQTEIKVEDGAQEMNLGEAKNRSLNPPHLEGPRFR